MTDGHQSVTFVEERAKTTTKDGIHSSLYEAILEPLYLRTGVSSAKTAISQTTTTSTSSDHIINVDLDGVLFPFWQQLRQSFFLLGKDVENMKAPTRFDFWEEWGMSEGEWRELFRRAIAETDLYLNGDPIPGAVDNMWRLSDDGWNIRIVTKRLNINHSHADIIRQTVRWLDDWNIPYRGIAFLGNESKQDYHASIIIDDQVSNLVNHPAELRIVFDQPWNQEHEYEHEFFYRTPSWERIYKLISEQQERGMI